MRKMAPTKHHSQVPISPSVEICMMDIGARKRSWEGGGEAMTRSAALGRAQAAAPPRDHGEVGKRPMPVRNRQANACMIVVVSMFTPICSIYTYLHIYRA